MATTSIRRLIRSALLLLGPLLVGLSLPDAASARDLPVVRPAMACADLAQRDIVPEGDAPARIITARVVSEGVVAPYCEVKGYVAPQVRFELRLPTENWMQRLMYSGCGGFCGRVDFRIRAAEGCAPIENGEFALVASDLGHDAPDGNANTVWAANNPQGKADYGHRGVHVVTVTAKAIIAMFYGQPQQYAYFNGCSDGGREGLMEAQRYPDDFDGIIAGAPVMNATMNNSLFHLWNAHHGRRADGRPMFSEADLVVLHDAALAACDTVGDDVADGIVGDPGRCRFDPQVVACTSARSGACLSAEQVAAARAMYAGPLDETGSRLYFGRPVGSELSWGGRDYEPMAAGFIRYMAGEGILSYDRAAVTFDRASAELYNAMAPVYNSTSPDLDAFRSGGGRLIMWHGWGDSGVPPQGTVDYYRQLQARYGRQADDLVQLYMLPGVGHCEGGEGPDLVNLVDQIVAWVEDGQQPGAVQAVRRVYGRVVDERTVAPYIPAS